MTEETKPAEPLAASEAGEGEPKLSKNQLKKLAKGKGKVRCVSEIIIFKQCLRNLVVAHLSDVL